MKREVATRGDAILLRLARSAPTVPLREAACDLLDESASAAKLPQATRGRCASTAAGMALWYPHTVRSVVAATHGALPPTMLRCADGDVAAAAGGSAAWSGRQSGALGTPRHLAARLARDHDTAGTLALDALTPPAVLLHIARECRHGVFAALLANASCPPALLAAATAEPGLAAVAVKHRAFPAGVVARLRRAARGNPTAALVAAQSPTCSPEDLRAIVDAASGWFTAAAVACNANCPAGLLAALASHSASGVREHVAGHEACPPEVLAVLAGDSDYDVRVRAAGNRSCPAGSLAALADESQNDVIDNVAANEACPEDLQQRLAGRTALVRGWLACNPRLAGHLHDRLGRDRADRVRENMAANPNCETQTLLRLAVDLHPGVRAAAARTLRARGPVCR